jgi:hypothetical protein
MLWLTPITDDGCSNLQYGSSLQNESIYDIKNISAQTEAQKTAATDAAIWQKKCDEAMQTGFAHMMSVMRTRESMEAAIRSSLIPRYALFLKKLCYFHHVS